MEVNATLIVQAAFFCFLLLWLSPVLFRPMLRLFDAREAQIEGAKQTAQAYDEEARQELERVESQISEAFSEAKQLKLSMKEEAEAHYRTMVEAARGEAAKSLHEARLELDSMASQVSAELRSQVKPLSESLSSALLRGEAISAGPASSSNSTEVARA